MNGQQQGYHLGFELTKAHQAEMRAVAAQDRLALPALTARRGHRQGHLAALVHILRLHRRIAHAATRAVAHG
jgi:hypothetical protein